MISTLRTLFTSCFALFMLSGCSFFGESVLTCDEAQEYQGSVSIAPLIVPSYLQNVQDKSIFNIPNTQGINTFDQESFKMPVATSQSISIIEQNNQMGNIEGDELSELLQLIDQTISNRQLEGQFEPMYDDVASNFETSSSQDPCLEGPPKYFTEKISPRSMPTQAYTQPSDASLNEEKEEKSRRQKRKEKRQQIDKQKQSEAEEDSSSEDLEDEVVIEEDKLESIFKAITQTAIGVYTGVAARSVTLAGGTRVALSKPTRPDDDEKVGDITTMNAEEETALAKKIRDLAILNPALSDEQRVFIQNMSDKQILEAAAPTMKEIEDQESRTEEDVWFSRVKDQWTEGKAQREARREARQQRRAERQAEDN